MLTRRRFAFWVGFGLFTLSERLHVYGLDDLAAATMRAAGDVPTPPLPATEPPLHWRAAENRSWRWFERETYIGGKWKLTGITTPVHKTTNEPKADGEGYLEDTLVPEEILNGKKKETFDLPGNLEEEFAEHKPSEKRKGRHGRPPSKWLRSLNADELRLWLPTVEVPEAGVSGMTFFVHLTRDHSFDEKNVEPLNEGEQAKLHAAAHFGY